MLYSCAYFTEWHNDIDRAQHDKLDIGCGWGALICHAAKNYGVSARGVTLSQEQYDRTQTRIKEMGLEDLVTVEIRDYNHLDGTYDKISSIGMYEHIGLANIPGYMQKVKHLLAPGGLFHNRAIARRTRKKGRRLRFRAEHKAILKYIFPGTALTDIGHTQQAMEQAGFEVRDVEGWREHYALTCRIWCERLYAREDEAIVLVGEPNYRMWVAYLAGVSLSFTRGSILIYQALASHGRESVTATNAGGLIYLALIVAL